MQGSAATEATPKKGLDTVGKDQVEGSIFDPEVLEMLLKSSDQDPGVKAILDRRLQGQVQRSVRNREQELNDKAAEREQELLQQAAARERELSQQAAGQGGAAGGVGRGAGDCGTGTGAGGDCWQKQRCYSPGLVGATGGSPAAGAGGGN